MCTCYSKVPPGGSRLTTPPTPQGYQVRGLLHNSSLTVVIRSVVIQGGGASVAAGTAFSLTCTVTLATAGPVNISWRDPSGYTVLSGLNQSSPSNLTISKAAIFFSEAGNYTCMATTGPHQSYAVATIMVQSESLGHEYHLMLGYLVGHEYPLMLGYLVGHEYHLM